MERRTYLHSLGAVSIAGLAGCLDGAMDTVGLGDDSDTVLGSPDQSRGDPDATAYPVHGQAFPEFSLPDPITDETVSLEDFVGDRAILMTFFFTACPDGACPALLTRLRRVQEDAAERGYGDDIALLALTFDPERDTADVLADYGREQSVDYEADNWHFLRPETYEEGEELLMEEFGMLIQRVDDLDDHDEDDIESEEHAGAEDAGHGGDDHEGADHDDHDDHDHGEYTFNHINLILLANNQGVVERAYPQAVPQAEHDDLGGDISVIVEDARTVAQEQPQE